jgi:CRP-like cAMP-binding protein
MPVEPSLLKLLPLFDGLSTAEVEEVAAQMSVQDFEAGASIIREGDAPRHPIYVLLEGTVDVLKRGFDGRARVLTNLVAPSVFGELEMLTRRPAIAGVEAMSGVRAAVLNRGAFDEMLRAQRPALLKITKNLAYVLSWRLAATDERLAALAGGLAPDERVRLEAVRELLGASFAGAESPSAPATVP